jgi:hypothetical protein
MRRALLAAGAVLILSAPAFADEVTIEKKTTTITKEAPESGSTVTTEIIAPTPPPAPQAEIPPAPPGPKVAWVTGHWSWDPAAQNYVWVHGRYMEPPHAHAEWLPGRFVQRPDGWLWEDGSWE